MDNKPSMHAVIKQALCLILLLGCASADAKLRWYDVEVIGFSHSRGEYLNAETWPKAWQKVDTSDALDFTTLKNSLYVKRSANGPLSGMAQRIDDSSRYDLLVYTRWRQPGLKESRAKPVLIESQKRWSYQQDQGLDAQGNSVSLAQESPALSGTIKISLSRFLHINADMLYLAPLTVTEVISANDPEQIITQKKLAQSVSKQTVMQGFPLQTSRKTRSKETQFLDHPLFGLIVRITPVATS